jgi:hypothetical protein
LDYRRTSFLLRWASCKCGAERKGAAESFLPCVEANGVHGFGAKTRNGREKKSSNVGHSSGTFARDAVMGEHVPEFAEGVIDVGGGAKFARDGFEFGTDALGFEEKALLAGVEEAERGMGSVAEHFAAAVIGRGEGTTLWFVLSGLLFLLRRRELRNLVIDPSGHRRLLRGGFLRSLRSRY